jgi:NDP-sugar pyrophosphorylase family protein
MPEVTDYSNELQVFIVAGGKGTRSLNPKKAKILQEISSGINLIDLHLMQLDKSFFKRITFLLSKFSNEVITYLEEIKFKFPNLAIDWILDTSDEGTLGALLHAVKENQSERYLVILGDIAISADYNFLLEKWLESKTTGAVVVHPNLHPIESDKVLSDRFDRVTQIISKKDSNFVPDQPVRSVAGVFFFSHESFVDLESESGDISSDLLPSLADRHILHVNNKIF